MKRFKENILNNIVAIIGLICLLLVAGTFLGTFVSDSMAAVNTGAFITETDDTDGSKIVKPIININGTAHKADAVVPYKVKKYFAVATFAIEEDTRYIVIDADDSKDFWPHEGTTTGYLVVHDLTLQLCGVATSATPVQYNVGIGYISENDATNGTAKMFESAPMYREVAGCDVIKWNPERALASGYITDGGTEAFYTLIKDEDAAWKNDQSYTVTLTGGTILPAVGDLVIKFDEINASPLVGWVLDISYTFEEPIE